MCMWERDTHTHTHTGRALKANSHVPCRTQAVPLPCHAAPLPFSDSTVSFMKVRMVAGNIPTASYSLTDWYASDNNLRGNPRGSRKKPTADRSLTFRLWTADATSHMT
jgi:hypothetical protein